MFFFFEKPSRKIKQIGTVDATINCQMTFKTFPYDVQDCLFEIVPIERTQAEYLKMTTSMVEFSTWPRQFAPTASEFEYKVSELWCPDYYLFEALKTVQQFMPLFGVLLASVQWTSSNSDRILFGWIPGLTHNIIWMHPYLLSRAIDIIYHYYLSYLNVSSLKEKTHRYIVYEVKSHVIFFHRWCLWKVILTSYNPLVGTPQLWVSSSHWADTLRNISSSTICPQVDRISQVSDNPRPKGAIFLKCDT